MTFKGSVDVIASLYIPELEEKKAVATAVEDTLATKEATDGDEAKEKKKKKKQSVAEKEEYLRLNYPQDVRRNLKGLTLPDDEVRVVKKERKKNGGVGAAAATMGKGGKNRAAGNDRRKVTSGFWQNAG